MREELIRIYEDFYVAGFRSNDIKLIDQIVQYPIAYVRDGKVEMCNSYPVDPARLKIDLNWDHSVDWHYEIAGVSDTNAHMTASATRCRKDGSVIERVHGFYSFTQIDGSWKMYAVAELSY